MPVAVGISHPATLEEARVGYSFSLFATLQYFPLQNQKQPTYFLSESLFKLKSIYPFTFRILICLFFVVVTVFKKSLMMLDLHVCFF